MEFRGRRVKLFLNDDGGVFEGFIHSLDQRDGKLSLEKVYNCESGRKVMGLQHFYENEIGNIEVLEESTTAKEETERLVTKRGREGVMKSKYSPAHLSRLKHLDPSKLTLKNQSEANGTEAVDENLAENEVRSNDTYTILAHMDNVFTEAISFIRQHQVIGVSLEGVSLGRSGKLCWLQVGTPTHVFLFDILTLGEECIDEGLKGILEDENILKVFHDCRMASDILYHQYKINIVNVFDTQVADVFIYRLRHHNDWPRFVTALAPCLSQHLDLSPEQVHWAVIREHWSKEDEEVWAERPSKKHVVEAAVKDVIYLLELRQVLMEKMMEEFVAGVNIYLSHVRDASLTDSNKYQTMRHLLPVAFQDVRRFMESYRGRNPHIPLFREEKDQYGFRENCSGIVQPNVNFSHDSLWHAGSARKRENVRIDKAINKTTTGQSSREDEIHKNIEQNTMKHNSAETQSIVRQKKQSFDVRADKITQEPVDLENTALSGSSLMRALVYNQQESESDMDGLVLKPAGSLTMQVRKKKKSPQKPALVSHRDVSNSKKEISASSSQSDSEKSSPRKEINVKNSEKFLRDYKQFVRKGMATDSGSSDNDVIPGLNVHVKSPVQSPSLVSEQMNETNTPKQFPPYNFISRGMLSPQEIELFNSRRKSNGDQKNGMGEDNSSVCSDQTLSPEKEQKYDKIHHKNGISLNSLIANRKEYSSPSSHSVNTSHEKSPHSSAADNSVPVSQRMQVLLDAIWKNQSP